MAIQVHGKTFWCVWARVATKLHRARNTQIPFADFALTNSGQMAEQQLSMMREKVRTVGISVMLPIGAAGGEQVVPLDQDHPFDLGIES